MVFIYFLFLFALNSDAQFYSHNSQSQNNGRWEVFNGATAYLPQNLKANADLVVYLHGCTQSTQEAVKVTRLNDWADKKGFVALYPTQNYARNLLLCWNWSEKTETQRGSYEAQKIVDTVMAVQQKYSTNKKRIFVMGLSAGAAMTELLLACYPDVFAAGGAHSGLAFVGVNGDSDPRSLMLNGSLSTNIELAQKALECQKNFQKNIKWRKPTPQIVISGMADATVNFKNSMQALFQTVLLSDFTQTGRFRESSENIEPSAIETHSANEKKYSYKVFTYQLNTVSQSQLVLVDQLGHAWSGGPEGWPYSDSRGPDSTELILKFFSKVK